MQCAEKALFTAFWDAHSILLKFLDQRAPVNANCYFTTLRHLKEVHWMKCPGLLTEKVNLLYNNAHHYIVCITTQLLKKFQGECLVHPPYNLDLSLCDFHLIRSLKKCFEGKCFQHHDEVKSEMC
jgi:hypothetical protein